MGEWSAEYICYDSIIQNSEQLNEATHFTCNNLMYCWVDTWLYI